MASKPRLLYFAGPWDYLGERIVTSYMQPLRRLLDQDFEVVELAGDRDFRQEVETHRPDMVLFHTGTESPQEPVRRIRNTDAFPDLPRAAYILRDPCSPTRAVAMNRIREWGVHQVFNGFRPGDAPIPFFQDAFYLPWWIDDTVLRDYGETKNVPIALTGAGWTSTAFYPWRAPIFARLIPHFGIMHVPVGNTAAKTSRTDFTGERYARLLNRSHFAAGCGSINHYLTLKLLEIPACRSCLITEETEILQAAGFVDGENCIFAQPSTVTARVQYLLDHPTERQRITDNGYALVQARHTQRNRRMFREWFDLQRARQPGQRIVQPTPFAPLALVAENPAAPAWTERCDNPLVEMLQAGYAALNQAAWQTARSEFDRVLTAIDYVAEARLGKGIALLHLGDAEGAVKEFLFGVSFRHLVTQCPLPDPLMEAFTAAALWRAGHRVKAAAIAGKNPTHHHPALNALRWLFAQHDRALARYAKAGGDQTLSHADLHLLPPQTFEAWVESWRQLTGLSAHITAA